jgi:hypothetical protein
MGRHSCCYKQKLRKGLWSPEEDEKLLNYITKHGHGCWSSVSKQAGTPFLLIIMQGKWCQNASFITPVNIFQFTLMIYVHVYIGRFAEVWKELQVKMD